MASELQFCTVRYNAYAGLPSCVITFSWLSLCVDNNNKVCLVSFLKCTWHRVSFHEGAAMFVRKPGRGQTPKYSYDKWTYVGFFFSSSTFPMSVYNLTKIKSGLKDCFQGVVHIPSIIVLLNLRLKGTHFTELLFITTWIVCNTNTALFAVDLPFFFLFFFCVAAPCKKQLWLFEKQVQFRQLFFFVFYCWLIVEIFNTCV